MVAGNLVTVTDAEILDLNAGGQYQHAFEFALLDTQRNELGTLDVGGSPTLDVDTSRTTFRTLSGLTIKDPPAEIDLTRHRVQPRLILSNGSVWPLGVLMFGEDARQPYTTGTRWQPQLFDETFLLDQDLDSTWSLAKGDSLLELVNAIVGEVLDPLGIPHSYNVADAYSGADLVFKPGGGGRYEALRTLFAALGCFPPFFDHSGLHTTRLAPDSATPADHTYGAGTRIVDGSTTLTSSTYKAPNRYIVIGADLATGVVRGVYDLPPAAPNSAAQTGRIVRSVHSVPGIGSIDLANIAAYVDALTDRTSYGKAAFATPIDPRHGIFDTVDLFGDRYLETGWSAGLTAGADNSHQCTRMWT